MGTSLRTRYASGLLQKKHPNVVDKLTALGFVWNHQKHVVTATLVPDTTLGKNSVRKYRMIQKHYPELLEDLGDATSSPSSSSASGGDGVSKNKKSLPFAKVN